MAATHVKGRARPDRYLELVSVFPLRPIRSADAHQQAKRVFRSLAAQEGRKMEQAVRDYRTVLASLIATYETDAGHRLDTRGMSAAAIVRHLLAERSVSVNAFAKEAGVAQSALSAMLGGKREWSRAAIIRVADFLGLERGLFLR